METEYLEEELKQKVEKEREIKAEKLSDACFEINDFVPNNDSPGMEIEIPHSKNNVDSNNCNSINDEETCDLKPNLHQYCETANGTSHSILRKLLITKRKNNRHDNVGSSEVSLSERSLPCENETNEKSISGDMSICSGTENELEPQSEIHHPVDSPYGSNHEVSVNGSGPECRTSILEELLTRRNRVDCGLGSSRSKRVGLKKVSYCEDTGSGTESASGDECLPSRKKRTVFAKNKNFLVESLKTFEIKLTRIDQVPEIPVKETLVDKRSNCATDVRSRLREPATLVRRNNLDCGLGSSKPKRVQPAKLSYYEDTSSTESVSGDEFLPPRKKRTNVAKKKMSKVQSHKTVEIKSTSIGQVSDSVKDTSEERSNLTGTNMLRELLNRNTPIFGLLGSSSPNPNRLGLAKKSYCERDTSETESVSGDERLPPRKKKYSKIVTAKIKPSNTPSKLPKSKLISPNKQVPEIQSSVPVIKQEPSSDEPLTVFPRSNSGQNDVPEEKPSSVPVIKQECDEPLTECQSNNSKPKDVPAKGKKKNKKIKKRKKSTSDTEWETKDFTFQEVCEIVQSEYGKDNRTNRGILKMLKQFFIYSCRSCTSDFHDIACAKDHYKNEHPHEFSKDIKMKFGKYMYTSYKCKQCERVISGVSSFIGHLKTFHNLKQPIDKCDKCRYVTRDKQLFWAHLESHKSRKTGRKWECHLCGLTVASIIKHLLHMHGEHKIKCPQCPKTFGCKSLANAHRLSLHGTEKNLVCKKCKMEFQNGKSLTNHCKTHHMTEPRFACPSCNEKFHYNISLVHHMTTHTGIKLYSCAHCARGFNLKSNLLRHIAREHQTCDGPEKNHLCETCGKAFVEKATLERHMVVHTKEKKFVCATCNKGFTQLDSLKSHQVVHTGIKPFECGKCGNKYSQKYPLTQHIKKHHPD